MRDATEQRPAERAPRASQEELEEQIRRRTDQLARANEALKREVEARARAMQALAESEEKYRLLVENMNDGLVATDENALCIYVNGCICEMLGFSREEFVGRSIADFLDDSCREIFAEQMVKRKSGGKASYEVVLNRKDGNKVHAIVSPSPVFDPDGRFKGSIGVITDVTEWKRTEEALIETEEKYQRLVEYAPAAVYEIDLNRNRLTSVSDVASKYTGYTKEELLTMDASDLLVDESKQLFYERMGRFLRGEKVPERVIFKLKGKNGRESWAIFNIHFIFRDGKPSGAKVFAHDITKLKETEQALLRSEKELRLLSNRLLIAQEDERKRIALDLHDTVLQKLAYIKLSLGMKLRQPENEDSLLESAFLEETISLVRDSISDIRSIIEDLRPPILDELGILPAIKAFCRDFQERYPEITIELRTAVHKEDISDSLKIAIFRVLQEALNNIAKHSSANRVLVSLQREDGAVSLRVSDDGVGFKRDDPPSREKSDGGFGLTSMKERAKLSGGAFSIRSEPGEGTTITVDWRLTGSEKLTKPTGRGPGRVPPPLQE